MRSLEESVRFRLEGKRYRHRTPDLCFRSLKTSPHYRCLHAQLFQNFIAEGDAAGEECLFVFGIIAELQLRSVAHITHEGQLVKGPKCDSQFSKQTGSCLSFGFAVCLGIVCKVSAAHQNFQFAFLDQPVGDRTAQIVWLPDLPSSDSDKLETPFHENVGIYFPVCAHQETAHFGFSISTLFLQQVGPIGGERNPPY